MSTAVVAPARTWTETELMALRADGYCHEVVKGELVTSPQNTVEHGQICARLMSALMVHVESRRLGIVLDSSTGFWMQNRNCRAPDVSFVSRERLAGLKRPPREFFRGAPDLAVEVLAPSNTPAEITERLRDYFASGTRIAWIIHPAEQFAEVCHSPTERRLLASGGALDGEAVLPGFSYLLAELFKDWDWD